VVRATAVIAALGQRVDAAGFEASGLLLTPHGIAADPRTLATNLPGVFAGGDGVTGPDLAVRAVAAGRLAAVSIDQFLGGRPVRGEPGMVSVLLGKLDEGEMAELFREIEKAPRAPMPTLPLGARARSFDEVELGYSADAARQESARCLNCGCFKANECRLRQYATEYGADPLRFAGARRRFRRDSSHPGVVYEPGKCILCGACVEVTSGMGQRPGVAILGRGFEAAVGVPFGGAMWDAFDGVAARRIAEVCPTGAFATAACAFSCTQGD
jgi:formate dehydrogenase major subunit